MTSKQVTTRTPDIIQLPDPRPCDLDMTTFDYVNFPAYPASLAEHLGNPDTTIITSEVGASLRATTTYDRVRFPDLLIAFDVDPLARRARNGYVVEEQGKPPDFVLEVASASTARLDETVKREEYAALGVVEYWRFDHTGGQLYRTSLAGDVLVDDRYQAITIHETAEGSQWGHSEVLNLDLCWEDGLLRWWDPASRRYLSTYREEFQARAAAESRIRELEEELRRRQNG